MNKKRLSVVMAGAMLASAVAPVMAAEVTDVNMSEKSLLAKKIVDLAKTKMISTNSELKTNFVSTDVANLMKDNASAYGIKVLNKDGKEVALNTIDSSVTGDVTYDIKEIEKILSNDALKADMTVQVVERKTTEFLGQIIPGTQIEATGKVEKYGVDDFQNPTTNIVDPASNDFVKEIKVNDKKTGATVTLEAIKDLTASKEENVKIELNTESDELNFNLPLDKDGKITDKVQECVGFATKASKYQKSAEITADPEVKESYKLVDDSKKAEQVTYLAKDLYDGLALTAKGTEIQKDIENAKKVAKENNRTGKETVKLGDRPSKLTNGVAEFKVTYYASYKDVTTTGEVKVVTVKSTNLKELQSLYDMMTTDNYTVGIVAGANRYETAVNVAKAQGINETANADNANQNDIVLVNGESLVDGLAAAPLAADKKWNNTAGTAVLLSKSDSLPTATKDFLEELTVNVPKSKLKNVKIHLVGGEAVLSESLVDELKDMGFSVERYGGDNREETSLEVAEALGKVSKAFIVGAEGEADAMSIATVAVKEKTPIIVSKKGGLTKDAIRFIEKNLKTAANDNVAVIGGESVVSKADYDKIDAVTNNKVARVAGDNRFETNAAIIEKYAPSDIDEVVLVKDGQRNKEELVDALAAANYANGNPIVLATDKITDNQKVAILDKKGTDGFTKLTQVGQGVARTTLESIAEFLGLSNVK
ncbi:cell wall-binding repeat-containing protein [Fusobacterium sp.]|uniref:cell wall-binding repeat-containing protein n=1 Tax=Fusobacterium sp. TaxID=68766 RepID=UPI00260D7E4F|nr:cell wall-binding repeat-containing protein [Fusobacterium sp.]